MIDCCHNLNIGFIANGKTWKGKRVEQFFHIQAWKCKEMTPKNAKCILALGIGVSCMFQIFEAKVQITNFV